ncbi:DUF5129 domain-containing protein [Arthrobacter rhombi]|uniref:DUF5129 domain-containing protein n=1 Tax=Arthrobacter rhombi TaxID=71253 RepID=UPI003FD498A2
MNTVLRPVRDREPTTTAGARLARLLAAAALAVAALVGVGSPAQANPPKDVVVTDTAGILDESKLVPAIKDTSFRSPTTVVVLTQRGAKDDIFNERVLAYARDHHPEWLSADGQKWADGLFIVAIDPDGRHIGTYLGEDRKVSMDAQSDIQDAAKDLLADAQWTDGAIEAVQAGARIINRPWYLHPVTFVLGGLGVLVVGAVVVLVLNEQRKNRRAFAEALAQGDEAYANVTMDLDVTELNARTIPTESTYGARVLERYREFRTRYTQLTGQRRDLEKVPTKVRSTVEGVSQAEAFAEAAVSLDKLDDVIADANSFLNRDSSWDEAWENQTRDLREDLDGIDEVLKTSASDPNEATAASLLSFRDEIQAVLPSWRAGLADGSMTPDEGLDTLRDTRARLSELFQAHAEAAIAAHASSTEEEALMREELKQAQEESTRPRARRTSILTTSYPGVFYFSAATMNTGYTSGQASVASAQSSSSSGYGSSGGSFSGSGSSSSF